MVNGIFSPIDEREREERGGGREGGREVGERNMRDSYDVLNYLQFEPDQLQCKATNQTL